MPQPVGKMYRLVLFLTILAAAATAFAPQSISRPSPASASAHATTELRAGFLQGLFGDEAAQDTRVAEASHILLTGPDASAQCEQLKIQIYKDALGWFGKAENGVEPAKLIKAFSAQARAQSTCPSGKAQGGSLGYFPRGQMVKEFDDVAFGAQVGIVHGPVETEFGSHLILVTDRTEE